METQIEQTPAVDEKKIIETLFSERDTYQSANQTQRAEFNDIYNVYIGKMDNVKSLPYKTRESSSKLRTEIAYIVPSIFSGIPQVEVEGIGQEDKPMAMIFEKMINYRFETIEQFYEKIEGWVKQSVTFGTSVLEVFWDMKLSEPDEQGMAEVKKDEPNIIVHNILDTFYNPILPDVEVQKSVIFRSVLPVADVKKNQMYDFSGADGTLNREKIEEKGNATTDQYNSNRQQTADAIDIQKSGKGTVEVYERVTCDRIQTVVDGKERLVLRDKPLGNGYISAVKLTHEPNCIPNRFEGWGVGHNTMGVGKQIYRAYNQINENVKLINNPMFLAKRGKNIDPRQAVAKPGGVVFMDDDQQPIQNSLTPLIFPDVKQSAIAMLDRMEDEHRRASGANDMVQGATSNKTLGQDQIASSYSAQRFELVNRRFKQALSDVAKIILDMEIKNIQSPDAPILRIFPEELRQQIFEMIINEGPEVKYNVRIKGDTNVAKNKDVQIKQLIDAFNLFGESLPPENQMEWARKILELRGVDDVDKLVPSAEKMQEHQATMQAQAMSPEMMQEGGMTGEVPQPMA